MNIRAPFLRASTARNLQPGDIVSVRFPYPSTEDCRARDPRPCLVIDREDYLSGTFVELLPGTQSMVPAVEPSDVLMDATAFSARAPMRGDWRFIAALHDRFDINHPGFDVTGGTGPLLLGHAYGSALDVIAHLRGQLQATREMHISSRRSWRDHRQKK